MIWNFCIRRPVLTSVVFVAVAIFGVYGFNQMPVREQPDVEPPIVSVNVVLPGAEPGVLETEVVEPLEEEINTVEGLKTLTSTARESVASITAEFELWRDIDVATQDVRDRIVRVRRSLPDDIEEPIVRKLDPDAQPIMWIALTGDERWDTVRMTEYADNNIKERLEGARGVGQVMIGGERAYAVRVQIDPARLAAHHLTVQDVVDTIRRNNVDIPTGRIESRTREFLVKTRGQFSSAEPINDLIVAHREGTPVRISDVGQAVDGIQNDRQLARFTGSPSVGLGIVKQSDANAVTLAHEVRQRMSVIGDQLPPGLEYAIATDSSEYVEENINDLITTIFLATGLVVLVVMVFLRTVRATFVVSLAIPTSLLAGMAIMNVMGFSLNVLSMLALILVIGIVVDDAIVVLESSYRHMENGAEPEPAARTGTTEVAFPAIANTLALAAVFIPVAFTAGMIGRFFFEFGITVSGTVLASTATALTLTPMLCSRALRVRKEEGPFFSAFERGFVHLENLYKRVLAMAFRHSITTIGVGVGALCLGLMFFLLLPTEFAPEVDRSELMVSFELPEGATLAQTDAYAREIEKVFSDTPQIHHWFLAVALSRGGGPGKVNEGLSFVHLTPRDARDMHQIEVMQQLRQRLNNIPMGRAFVISPGGGGGGGGAPLQVVLQSTDLDELARQQTRILEWMQANPEYVGVNSNLKMNKPRQEISVHRDRASETGISVAEISNTLRYLLADADISKIERGSDRYDVITEVAGKRGLSPDILGDIYIRGEGGNLVPLASLVEIEETIGPSAIHHFNRMRAATLSASTPPDVTLGDALDKLQAHLDETLPADFNHTVTGQAQQFEESFYYLSITMVMAIVFIFLVLAAQFESLLHPFTILLTLPLATVGVFGSLWALDMSFNVFGFIGLIMLLGLVTKNGILLIDYTLVLEARGHSAEEAARNAAGIRFRPVLMTAISTMLGMMPIALGYGAGAEARAPLGVSVAAGMGTAVLLTLVVIPVVYTRISRAREHIAAYWSRRHALVEDSK